MSQGTDPVIRTGMADSAPGRVVGYERTHVVVSEPRPAMSGQADEPESLVEHTKEVAGETVGDIVADAKAAAREVVEEATGMVKDLVGEARDLVRRETVGRVETLAHQAGDTGQGVATTVRSNPIPAALIGIGLGWLWLKRRNAQARPVYGHYDRQPYPYLPYESGVYPGRYDSHAGYPGSYPGYPRTGAQYGYAYSEGRAGGYSAPQPDLGDIAGRAGQGLGDTASRAGELAGNVADQVGQAAGSVAGTVGETASNLMSATQETAGNLVGGVQYQAQRVEDRFGRALRENPLAVGVAALALGAAVGMVLPQTARENQLMGEARDSLVEKAQDVVQEKVEKVQAVAGEAQQTVKDEAAKQGLTQ
jgi:uncharacterized protein YjbJ (UPF0337 family)